MLRHCRYFVVWTAAAVAALVVFVTLCLLGPADATRIRVVAALGLGHTFWWLATVLSFVIPTSLLVALVRHVCSRRRRNVLPRVVNPGRESNLPKKPGTIKTGTMHPVRRSMLRAWFVAILLWILLETIGAVWTLTENTRGNQPAGDTAVRESPIGRLPLPPLPEVLNSKHDDELRLLVMGGSTAGGDPYSPVRNNLYSPGFSFIEAVERRMQELFPKLKVESAKFAFGGGTLEDAYGLLCRVRVHPDVIVVYSGHNEFFTRFSPDREVEVREETRLKTPVDATATHLFSPSLIARCIEDRLATFAVAAIPPDQNRRRLFDRPLCTRTESEHIYRRFRETLVKIVRFCRQQDIQPILIIPAANESGFEPSRSWLPVDFPAAKRRQLESIYEQLETGEPDDETRTALLESALELAPQFAETCFRLGHEYEHQGRFSDARRCYQAAIDFDGYPLRAPSRFAQIYREVADQFDAHLIDAGNVLRPLGTNGIVGDALIHDNCHPNVTGYTALANATLNALHQLHVPNRDWPSSFEELTPQQLVRYFAINRSKWAEVFEFVGRDYSDNLSLLRYDSAGRLKKGDAYRAAAVDIRAGTWPLNNGTPDTRVVRPRTADR